MKVTSKPRKLSSQILIYFRGGRGLWAIDYLPSKVYKVVQQFLSLIEIGIQSNSVKIFTHMSNILLESFYLHDYSNYIKNK